MLFGNEPRSYGETSATVVRAVGPPAGVFEAEPEYLDREMLRLFPHLASPAAA